MTRKLISAGTLAAAALTVALFAADTAREQKLQQAIDLMESKGDVAKAIPMFEEVARSTDKALAVRALLHLGQAQERQGADKARATYNRIVNEFGTDAKAVAAAKERLNELGGPRHAGTLSKTRICPDCGDSEANLSPDGQLMVFTDWDTGDIAIRDTSTLQVKRLLAQAGSWNSGPDPGSYAETPVFSPDLRQIAYLWETGGKDTHDQLRVMSNETGAKSRILLDTPENSYYEVYAWSHDGKSVLVTIDKTKDKTSQLAWVSASDGSVKVVKALEWRTRGVNNRPEISPDGHYIAYAALLVNPKAADGKVEATDSRVYIVAADGSSETVLDKTSGINEAPVWTPDGSHILFMSDRSGMIGLYSKAVKNGQPSGSASPVMLSTGKISPIGMSRSGSYRYTLREDATEQVSIVELGKGGISPARPGRVTEAFVGIRPSWSPDGKLIAFKRHHPGTTEDYDLVVHSLETGDERTYLTSVGTTKAGQPGWSHDGKSIGTGIAGTPYVVDLESGEFKLEKSVPFAPDERIRYGVQRDPKDAANVPDRIVALDRSTGQVTTLYTLPKPGQAIVKLSPDGRTLAVRWVDQKATPRQVHFARINIDGRAYRELYAIGSQPAGELAWTSDSRGILFDQRNDSNDKYRIMRIPADGGTPEFTGVELTTRMQNMDVSPDGSRIVFSSTKSAEGLWVIDNVLSLVK